MNIAAKHIRQEPCVEHTACGFECERAGSMANIEDDSTPTRLGDLMPYLAARSDRRIWKGSEAMCYDVAGTKASHDLAATRRRRVEMCHDWKMESFSRFDRHVERRHARTGARVN